MGELTLALICVAAAACWCSYSETWVRGGQRLTKPRASSNPDFFFFHSVLHWSVAVSTICQYSSLVVAFLHAVARLKFRGPMSASIAQLCKYKEMWILVLGFFFQLCPSSPYTVEVDWEAWEGRLGCLWGIWGKWWWYILGWCFWEFCYWLIWVVKDVPLNAV